MNKLTDNTNKLVLAAVLLAIGWTTAIAQRTETVLHGGWRFSKQDAPEYSAADFDDSEWEEVTVPHDWAISGPFNSDNDKQVVAIQQNGEKDATEHTGRTGSLPWIGTGWYRLQFEVDKDCERAVLNFDGAMSEPVVYVNGHEAGGWKYGYNSFNVDITPYINKKTGDNQLAVRLQNLPESSRWYPGAGIYRPVTLIQTHKTAIDVWGINFVTDKLEEDAATVTVSASLVGYGNKQAENKQTGNKQVENKQAGNKQIKIAFDLTPRPRLSRSEAAVTQAEVNVGHDGQAKATMKVHHPSLWTPENPNLYDLTAYVYEVMPDGQYTLLDKVVKQVGIRTISVNKEHGFQLNGITRKIKGVCLHHDLGMIGSAVNKAALVRQIKMLKTMGCDAIRTSHNMPSQMQMDLCDSLGMMVMAESFDMWVYPKCKNGYCRFYNEWWERDLTNLVMANRVHPSIVMWSIGNEIPEQSNPKGTAMLAKMQNLIHSLDSTRLCTAGMDNVDGAIRSKFADSIDIPGLNYRTQKYPDAHSKLHHGFILGSETASTVSSRDTYKFPVVQAYNKKYDDGQCTGYDLEACSWSNIPEDDWALQDDNSWVIGEFVWTGFDYLGEPTPYDDYKPARSSYFGIFDLAGLPKDRYWLYRSRWNKDAETIHLLPHWTWDGREGEETPVYCYTNYPSAELFVNGKSQGRITKLLNQKKQGSGKIKSTDDPIIDRYRLRWNNVKYEPGEIRVVVYDENGIRKGEAIRKTAGKPDHLEIARQTLEEYSEGNSMQADGEDMAFFEVSVVDKNGTACPHADNQITVEVKGAADFKGICNGDATSSEVFTSPTMKVFNGKLVVGVISNGKKGKVKVTVTADGIKPATSTIVAK